MPAGFMPNGEPVPDKVIDDKGKLRPIRPRERLFAELYGCPDKPTFMNGTASYKQAYSSTNEDTARAQAVDLLARPIIRNTIADIINHAGLGIEVRADKLRDIIKHDQIGRVVSKTVHVKDDDGSYHTEVTSQRAPGWSHILKAIDLVNKTEGLYDRNQAAADVAIEEYKALARRFFGPHAGKTGAGVQEDPRGTSVSHLPSADENLTSRGKSTENLEGSSGESGDKA
jgi:hypothetical protein